MEHTRMGRGSVGGSCTSKTAGHTRLTACPVPLSLPFRCTTPHTPTAISLSCCKQRDPSPFHTVYPPAPPPGTYHRGFRSRHLAVSKEFHSSVMESISVHS